MSFAEAGSPAMNRVEEEDFTRAVHAMFDHQAEADMARQDLIGAGILESCIAVHSVAASGVDPTSEAQPEPGFWDRVIAMFIPDDDRDSYAEALRRGGVAVEVRTDTATYDRVVDILDRDGAVDLDERTETWRRDGWTGYTGRDPLDSASASLGGVVPGQEELRYAPPSAATAGFAASTADQFPVEEGAPPVPSPGALPADMLESSPQGDTTDPVPRSWNRDTSHGRTRVRTYVSDPTRPTGPVTGA